MADQKTPTKIANTEPRKMTPEELGRLKDWAKQYSKVGKCIFCNTNKWNADGMIWEIRPFFGGNLVLGEPFPIVPIIMLNCATCGHTEFINAILSGVMKKPEDEDGIS